VTNVKVYYRKEDRQILAYVLIDLETKLNFILHKFILLTGLQITTSRVLRVEASNEHCFIVYSNYNVKLILKDSTSIVRESEERFYSIDIKGYNILLRDL